jgi:hypothetical protein
MSIMKKSGYMWEWIPTDLVNSFMKHFNIAGFSFWLEKKDSIGFIAMPSSESHKWSRQVRRCKKKNSIYAILVGGYLVAIDNPSKHAI